MSQFNPDELASFGKEETHTKGVSRNISVRTSKKIPFDTTVTHHGEIIGDLSTMTEDIKCDCPDGYLHSDGLGDNYAHTVRLSGGEVGISCSGGSCTGLFIPDTPINKEALSSKQATEELDIGQLDTKPLLHFTEDMIPEPIRQWTLDNCMHSESSLNYGAVSAITVCSNLIGYRCAIKPKRYGSWKIIPNLWGMLIGNPSARKSPAMEQFIKPVRRLESEAAERFKQRMTSYEPEKVSMDIAQKVKKKAIEKAYENGVNAEIEKANSMSVPIREEPSQERFILNDGTTEAVGEIMSHNQRTSILVRDELSGFFASFQKAGREGDRSFYLEAHKGDSSYTYDRIGRGTVQIERLSIGIIGTIQPSVLVKHILSKNGESGDGLAQRMQLTVFSDNDSRPYYDEPVDIDAIEGAYNICKKLAYENYETMAGIHNDTDGIPYFRFNDEAQKIFVHWCNAMKAKECNESDVNMQAHIGKYYGLLPSLALTFFLIDKVTGVCDAHAITLSHLELAIKWCTVLETHARKMYQLSESKDEVSLDQKIITYVKAHLNELPKSFGEIAGNIRGADAKGVKEALKGIAEINGRKVIKLLPV